MKKKKNAPVPEAPMDDSSDKVVKTFEVSLTRFDLIHLRDLFSVILPNAEETVSQSLASLEKRNLVEANLWQKIQAACRTAKVQLLDKAPDYVIVTVGQPVMGVFQLATDPDEQDEKAEEESSDETKQPELLLAGRSES